MKQFLFILSFFLLSTKYFSAFAKIDSIPKFSKPFSLFKENSKDLIIYYIGTPSSPSKWRKSIVLMKTRNKWHKLNYYISNIHFKTDSISKKEPVKKRHATQLLNEIMNVKSENEIAEPCRNIIKKDTAYEIHDLNLISDNGVYIVEYKSNNQAGRVYQVNPFDAFEICPDNIERRKFKEIITRLENIQ